MKHKFRINRKFIICALACFAVLCVATASTYAYLVHSSGADETTLTKPTISGDIVGDNFANLQVKNNGSIKVYVRVVPIINFTYLGKDGAGADGIFYCAEPPSTTPVTYRNGMTRSADYAVEYNTTDWLKGGDGYYYLRTPLAVNATSAKLVNSFTVNNSSLTYAGYTYYLTAEAACEVIQCESMVVDTPAVEDAWGVTLAGDSGSNIIAAPAADFDPYA